ncbi:putative phage cell wall peptidase, NlpC/P60 family [Meinhardsimonia xiamenensis]|jgi:NlpC/P60 family putative phage cell wall peptidase|uniref:Putative phage cell wall peptidase, NlpC/P60 family n=1 Tax=Meinhardsimonia xiamenensis TaxID=990712 RepID=A0A1G9AH02_9RHOB|nr:peptidase [Meinhardsimonia xiamenensis]PRX35383.1 NlpC/P60 family putative phage cell wall peptidase [Meinhardsimonia xiamenensis]SDK26646.1 putative phage cell wall peptidase, NlpC/P60 family [Meinhardsimonia xiamenensis]
MSGIGAAAVAEARRWLGTPYVHQASTRGAGCDCLGLLRGVWRELYGKEPETVPPYTLDWDEPSGEEVLWRAARQHLVACAPGEAVEPGQVLLFRMRAGAVAKHLGIVAAAGRRPSFIHSYSGHGVVESPLSEPWARRVVARFSFPERGA